MKKLWFWPEQKGIRAKRAGQPPSSVLSSRSRAHLISVTKGRVGELRDAKIIVYSGLNFVTPLDVKMESVRKTVLYFDLSDQMNNYLKSQILHKEQNKT